jgi:hypothetical protein
MSSQPAGDSVLSCEEQVPLAWWSEAQPWSAPELARTYQAALARLNAVLGVGEGHGLEVPDDAGPRLQDLLRLEARLNLLMAMVGELLAAQRPPPPTVPVRLSGHWIEWPDAAPPPVGAELRVAVYLNPFAPDPVVLPGRVERVEQDIPLSTVRAVFVDPPPAVESALEKLVFRYHRRRVAEQRKSHGP